MALSLVFLYVNVKAAPFLSSADGFARFDFGFFIDTSVISVWNDHLFF